jgi:glycoside hydrolase-like protein
MVKVLGLDYAGGRPSPQSIKEAGYQFTCRYLTSGGAGLPGKLLTRDEYQALIAAGIGVAVNYETTADRMKQGYAAGVADARAAQTQLETIGYPAAERPVYFSADWDASPVEQELIDSYLRGAASVIGRERVGIYGSYYVVARCLDNGTATWAWQAGAWSGGQIEPRAHIYQHIQTVVIDGIPCDVNEALMRPDFGQHPYTLMKRRTRAMTYRIDPTFAPPGAGNDTRPDGSWVAEEHTITTPGPVGGWPGRIIEHVTFGWLGAFIQEAWSAPSGKHYVNRWDPSKKTGGAYIGAFQTQSWELPPGDTALILRVATRAYCDVTPECEH